MIILYFCHQNPSPCCVAICNLQTSFFRILQEYIHPRANSSNLMNVDFFNLSESASLQSFYSFQYTYIFTSLTKFYVCRVRLVFLSLLVHSFLILIEVGHALCRLNDENPRCVYPFVYEPCMKHTYLALKLTTDVHYFFK
jgi:hypothetical protein